jgi:NAD(P)-dependent dehydrogenase (short-subunit alcohol dehydrogenase family)
MADAKRRRVAVVAGVGPGLGAALVRKFVSENCSIGMLARSPEFIGKMATEIGREALAIRTDISNATQVAAAFHKVRQQLGRVEILIANASSSIGEGLMETTPEQFERSWRTGVLGAMIFTGATSSVRGRGGALAFSSAKFAVRGLAQALAVELWPKGIHVAHVVIDGVIDARQMRKTHALQSQESLLKPEAIARAYWNLIEQDRSAWSLELDLRPHNEAFFE